MSKAEQIATEIDDVIDHLAGTLDALVGRVSPGAIADRQKKRLKSTVIDETGSVRLEVVGPVVGAVAGVIVLGVVVRKILR